MKNWNKQANKLDGNFEKVKLIKSSKISLFYHGLKKLYCKLTCCIQWNNNK